MMGPSFYPDVSASIFSFDSQKCFSSLLLFQWKSCLLLSDLNTLSQKSQRETTWILTDFIAATDVNFTSI